MTVVVIKFGKERMMRIKTLILGLIAVTLSTSAVARHRHDDATPFIAGVIAGVILNEVIDDRRPHNPYYNRYNSYDRDYYRHPIRCFHEQHVDYYGNIYFRRVCN